MAGGTGDTLTISFRANTDHQDDPDKIPCPLGFSGLVIDPDAGTEGPRPPELPQTNEGTQSGMRITLHLEGGSGGGGYSATTPTAEHEGPRAELSVRFAQQDPCPGWADRICWRPYPLAQLHLDVTDVIYTGTWEGDEALPTLSGGYDETTNTITLTELEGEEGEEGGGKPSIKIMWPTGNLAKYLRLGGLLNNWYELDYRLRDPDDEVPTDQMPPMWVDGPNIPSDLKIVDFGPEQWDYAFRVPIKWTLAEGLIDPGPTGAMGLETYADWSAPGAAVKPDSKAGGWIEVAPDPEPGEEPNSPGIEFNEQGLNAWLANREEGAAPLTATEYTLLMEILPSYGRFNVRGQYVCGGKVYDLHGTWSFASQQSNLFTAPRVRVPVAYLQLPAVEWIVINYYWSRNAGEDLDTRTKLIAPIDGPDDYVGWDRTDNYNDYIQWSNDNMQYGYESVLVNAKLIKDSVAATDWTGKITIETRAYWYCRPTSKQVTITIDTYRGGTFSINNYQWTPDSEARLVTRNDFPVTVDYERCSAWDSEGVCRCADVNPEWGTGPYSTTNGSLIGYFTIDAAGKVTLSS